MEDAAASSVVLCKNSDCEEELPKNKHGKYAKFCPMCSTPTRLDIVLECPKCGNSRHKSKKGKYAICCGDCGHNYATVETTTTSVPSPKPTNARQTSTTYAPKAAAVPETVAAAIAQPSVGQIQTDTKQDTIGKQLILAQIGPVKPEESERSRRSKESRQFLRSEADSDKTDPRLGSETEDIVIQGGASQLRLSRELTGSREVSKKDVLKTEQLEQHLYQESTEESSIQSPRATIPKEEGTIPKEEGTIPKEEATIPKEEGTTNDQSYFGKDVMKIYSQGHARAKSDDSQHLDDADCNQAAGSVVTNVSNNDSSARQGADDSKGFADPRYFVTQEDPKVAALGMRNASRERGPEYQNTTEDGYPEVESAKSADAPQFPRPRDNQKVTGQLLASGQHSSAPNQFLPPQATTKSGRSSEQVDSAILIGLPPVPVSSASIRDQQQSSVKAAWLELPSTFKDLKVKVDEASQLTAKKGNKSVKFASQEQQSIKQVHKQFNDKNSEFHAVAKEHKSAKKSHKPKKERMLKEKHNELKSFAEKWLADAKLQSLIRRVEEYNKAAVYQPQEPQGRNPTNNCKHIVFLANLHTSIKHALSPVVQVEGLIGREWRILAEMKEVDGILRGECSTIPKSSQELYYKYFVYNKADDVQYIEQLDNPKQPRHVDFSKHGDDLTLYDGLITVDAPRGALETFTSYLWTKKPYAEKLEGYRDMLPNWLAKIRQGESTESLKRQIAQATTQQLNHLSTFVASANARSDMKQKLCAYLDDTCKEHVQLCRDQYLGTDKKFLSMLGLLELVHRYFYANASDVELKETANFISNNLLEMFHEHKEAQLFQLSRRVLNDNQAKSLSMMVLDLMKKLSSYRSTTWIGLIPLLHALKKIDADTQGSNMRSQTWWGTAGFDNIVQDLKVYRRTSWTAWLAMLKPFFRDCVVLPNTFLALLSSNQLKEFLDSIVHIDQLMPINGVLAGARHHIAEASTHDIKLGLYEAVCNFMRRINSWEKVLMVDGNTIELAKSFLDRFRTTAANSWISGNTMHMENAHIAANLYCLILEMYITFCDEGDMNKLLDSLQAKLSYFLDDFKVTLTVASRRELKSKEITSWELMFQCTVIDSKIRNMLTFACRSAFLQRIEGIKRANPQHIIDLYLQNSFDIQDMDGEVSRAALSIADGFLTGDSYQRLSREPANPKIYKLIDLALSKAWPQHDGDTFDMVRNLIEWGSFVSVCKFIWNQTDEDKARYLTLRNQERLAIAISSFESVVTKLSEGSISFQQFEVIKSSKEKLIEFCEVSDSLRTRRDEITKAMDQREDEVARFDTFVQTLTTFWENCRRRRSTVQREMDDWFDRDPSELTFQQVFDSTMQDVVCDLIPPDLRPCLEPFCLLIHRPIFHGIFHTRIREAGDSWEAVIQVYHAASEEYNNIIASFSQGTITIHNIEELAGNFFQGVVTKLVRELPELIEDAAVCEERQRQIVGSSQIAQYSSSANVLLKLKEEYELELEFTVLQRIVEITNKNVELQSIDLTILDTASDIEKIGQLEADCLQAYIDCKDFVKWAKETVEKKDISVFVDLAGSALGEDDMSAQKTRYLLNALNGYTPLLYDLDSESNDLGSFLALCESMWTELEANPELPNFLRESARELEFFRRVKSHFGNVEIATMAQATAINETGVYYIGNIHEFSKDFQSVDDVIQLKCQLKDEGGETEKKLYLYEDIKELQGKLTLAAGDKQKDNMDTIQEFDTMRDAVENLAKAYIDIRREGCIQFDDLLVVVHCNPRVEAAVEIMLQSIGKKIFGLRSDRTATQHCHDVYEYLRESTKAWRESMDQKRSEIAELNYYTTEQLVMMRKDLGKFLSDRQQGNSGCLDKAMPLLAMIYAMKPDDLYTAMLEFDEGEQNSTEEPVTTANVNYDEMDDNQQDKIAEIEELVGFTSDLAVQVANELGFDKSDDDYLSWNENRLAKLSKAEDLKRIEDDRTSDDVMAMIMEQQPGDSSLRKKLETLWEQFIAHTGKSIKNFLGIPQLGYVLKKLEALKPQCETRELPNWLERGIPALIAVPKNKTYSMVLTIYEADKDASPPTRSEVLVCNKHTRTEEVVLFLNRALKNSSSYYCMVNCHLINYEICRIIEQRLNKMADQKDLKYGLAFIYAEEASHPRIQAHLDRYQIRNPPIADSARLKEFVAKLLVVDDNVANVACSVDPNRSLCRLIRSDVSGCGKSLLKRNLCNQLRQTTKLPGEDVTIPIYKTIDTDTIIKRLTRHLGINYFQDVYHTIHLDIAYEVETGVDELLFNLIILRSVVNTEGIVWQARETQYYIIECMPHMTEHGCSHEVVDLLPTTMCHTPDVVYKAYTENININGFDLAVLQKVEWQTVLKYLDAYKNRRFTYRTSAEPAITSEEKALQLLLENCGLNNPTWAELRHYIHFLYSQLKKVATSPFCQDFYSDSLRGFKQFVVEFMLKMARDFATRSLVISEDSQGAKQQKAQIQVSDELDNVAIKKKWEDSNHPYLFFNEDGESVTPLGFLAEQAGANYRLLDCESKQPFIGYDIPGTLVQDLARQKVTVSEDFKTLTRQQKLERLRKIMVNQVPRCTYNTDPNENYVLTMDNAKKIIAIHQRLRVGIPVIIMGETGCGKTLLIEFLSKLQVPTELKDRLTQTMVIVKIHGGTSEADIIGKMREAQALAKKNREICVAYANSFNQQQIAAGAACNICSKAKVNLRMMPCNHTVCAACITSYTDASQEFKCLPCSKVPSVYTVLFLDEANTTEAIGLVKEILCDGQMNGEPLDLSSGLKIIAACNPYRKHTAEMINKLQKAGLGYSVDAADTSEKFGKIPLRHLVYRVHALPQSLLPLVWDFGTLKSAPYSPDGQLVTVGNVESAYITQMIDKFEKTNTVALTFGGTVRGIIARMLSRSQTFMRNQKDECSFVSLRDIQRLLNVLAWFYQQRAVLFIKMQEIALNASNQPHVRPSDAVISVLLAIGVCYMARLEEDTRIKYAEYIRSDIDDLMGNLQAGNGKDILFQQIQLCQELFVNEVVDTDQHENISKNKALRENVFMMIVCIENRIPLFVVGKPGSSKSLSKSLVFDSMKGSRSKSNIFQKLKATYMVSFQCSRHATPDGIIGVFTHCAKFQKDQDLDKFVSVVVLDEVGLAEDSENLPLKALHPLLEDGCEGNTKPEPYMKCAFIGISNWALDPAKMNRGILVQRGSLDKDELLKIAREICGLSESGYTGVDAFIRPLAEGFRDICEWKKPVERINTEFFGLRDYYSVIKMVANFAKETGQLNRNQLIHSIKRNFGGFDPVDFDPMGIFEQHCRQALKSLKEDRKSEPPTDSIKLIDSCLSGVHTKGLESRYLLILTESLSVLTIILDMLGKHTVFPEVVFGSKFPDDVSYTQVCHNIFRIKTCMDLGRPVILLNLDDLYESLYDALNQYFTKWGDKKFVDIGLGTHRVKAFVNDGFRLIVIAEKNKVYKHFPIPLINRLEKHYVSATSLLKPFEVEVKERLEEWMEQFVTPDKALGNSCPFDCEGCKAYLSQPYKLSCGHYIGNCCSDKIALGELDAVCPVKDCGVEIDEEHEWRLSEKELRNRQYFENSSTTSAFIGYSSELTALAIKKAGAGAFHSCLDEIHNELFERAKFHLLQCATGESLLRLDKTMLKAESAKLQRIYMEEQKHETLLQYLEHELPLAGGRPLFIQVTSFSQLMVRPDIADLHRMLNAEDQLAETWSLYLKDFVRESQFTEKLRRFYWQKSTFRSKLMIVQCEAGDENTELLDAVRYIIQRETREAPGSDEKVSQEPFHVPNHTVLLLSLPRGHSFNGYQGGVWKCVHVDDPRSPMFKLPTLNECMQLKPSDIIGGLLDSFESSDEQTYDGPPPLEGSIDDEDARTLSEDDEYPDTELPQVTSRAGVETRFSVNRIMPFIKHCIPTAMSIITSSRSAGRVTVLKNLVDREEPEFLEIFLTRVHALLSEQETYLPIRFNWVKEDAVKASNMRTSETLRHAIEDAFERAIVPSLAAVISFIDVQHNLSLLKGEAAFKDLWLQIFEVTHKLGLSFDKITVAGQSKLPRAYKMHDAGQNKSDFDVRFPFSWIVMESIERLQMAAEDVSRGAELADADQLENRLSDLFKETPHGQVVTEYMDADNSRQLTDNYIHDFVYMSHPCRTEAEHWIVQKMITRVMQSRYEDEEMSVVHVHVIYQELKEMMRNLTNILSIDLVVDGNKRSIADELKAQIENEDEGVATHEPCDLVAIRLCLTILASTRLRKLQENPQEWIDQMDQAAAVMATVFLPSVNHDDYHTFAEPCRQLWLQLEVKKLYTEHVILPSTPGPDNKRNSFKLNDLIQCTRDGNFQSNEAFQKVVGFLTERVRDGVRALYPGCPRKCPMCERSMDSPIKLSCGHMLCDNCTTDNEVCPSESCGAKIQVAPSEGSIELQALLTFKDLRRRLNNFFMHFISKMVFSSDGSAPDEGVIDWLISRIYSETGTRDFAFYDSKEAVDQSPVLRSFLLKLFLQCEQNEPIIESLDRMMMTWGDGAAAQQLSTMTMIIDCHKELYESSKDLELNESVNYLMGNLDELISEQANERIVNSLTTIAEIQCHICNVVEKILFTPNQLLTGDQDEKLKEFLNHTREQGNKEPGLFVVRHLRQREGESFIVDLLNTPNGYFIPIYIQAALSILTAPDILSVYGGDKYQTSLGTVRQLVAQSTNMDAIDQFYQNTEVSLILQSLFTGVTRPFSQNVPIPAVVRQSLLGKLTIGNKMILQRIGMLLLDPNRMPQGVDIRSSQGLNIFMLILHLLSATHERTGDLTPLVEIINRPAQAAARLFPTMEDNQIDVQREVNMAKIGTGVTLWYCPNWHPYVIGECGQPMQKSNCLSCGAAIGGASHTRVSGVVRASEMQQLTKTGHILGSPATGIRAAQSVRDLSAQSSAVLRCLTHLAMYMSALINPDQAMAMVKPMLSDHTQLVRFLHDHIKKDWQLISDHCAVSTDDCILLLHDVINTMNTHSAVTPGTTVHLTKTRERHTWEAGFDQKYLKKTLNNQNAILARVKAEVASASDSSLGDIIDVPTNPINSMNFLASPGLWDYRRPMTLAAMKSTIQKQDCAILKIFVDRCYQLMAIRCLPDIMTLTQLLSDKFHSRFSRDKALGMSADEFCREYDNPVVGLRGKMEQFIKAWNIMVDTVNSGAVAQVDLEKLPDNPPLAEFLFDIYSLSRNSQSNKANIGAAPFILTAFLVDRHNGMLANDERKRSAIDFPKVISSNLVSISSEDEILDLVQSHSEYALGDTSVVTYDWAAIDRELDMRYIGSKPRILLTRNHLPSYMYQEDFSLLSQLKAIGESQERLHTELEASITNSLIINVQTLTDHLKELHVVINFLSAMSHIEKENSLADFLKASIGSEKEVTYLVAEVKLKHVKHVWFILKYAQATRLMEQWQEPFDDVEPSYRKELSEDLIAKLKERCLYNSSRTKFLLQMLFEFIILKLNRAVTADFGEREDTDTPLHNTLVGYIYGLDDDSLLERVADLPELPDDLLVDHSARAWCHIWEMFNTPVTAVDESVLE